MSLQSLDNRKVMVTPPCPTREERIERGIELIHHRHEPVLLIGHGSSGTSISAGLMRKYCGVAFGNESQFMIRFLRNASRYGDLSVEANLRRYVRDILKERYFERAALKYNYHPTEDLVVSRTGDRTPSGVFRAIFGLMADAQHTERWGDKTPEYIHHLPELIGLFPDAQVIYAVRDGRDVALSVCSRYFGANNVIMAALEWRECAELAEGFLKTLPPESYYRSRYEDAIADPVQWLGGLMEFLEVEPKSPEMLERISGEVRSELKSGTVNKWKTALTSRQREIFESIAGDYLRKYGYETEFDNPRPPSKMELAWAPWDDRFRALTSWSVWKDNFYRAGLRLKDLGISVREMMKSSSSR